MASRDSKLEHVLPEFKEEWKDKYRAPQLRKDKDYHVFLSHSYDDIHFTKAMCKILEDLGYKVFFADRDSVPGHSIIQEVSAKMRSSDRVLMLVTHAFLESNFFDFESNLALMYGYERKILTLIPVLCDVEHHQVPDELTSGPVYVKLKDSNFWDRIFQALTIDAKSLASVPAGDVAHGLAWSFYYGYLKLVLPKAQGHQHDLGERLAEMFKNRSQWEPDVGDKAVAFNRMLIIVPRSCFCPPSMAAVDSNIFPPKMKGTDKAIRVNFQAARAGHPARDYSGTLSLIKDPESDTEKYYACQIEFATPVMSMFEMVSQGGTQAGITQQALQAQRILFVDKLRDILGKCPMQSYKNALVVDFDDDKKKEDSHALSRHVCRLIKKKLDMQSSLEKAMEETKEKLDKL